MIVQESSRERCFTSQYPSQLLNVVYAVLLLLVAAYSAVAAAAAQGRAPASSGRRASAPGPNLGTARETSLPEQCDQKAFQGAYSSYDLRRARTLLYAEPRRGGLMFLSLVCRFLLRSGTSREPT